MLIVFLTGCIPPILRACSPNFCGIIGLCLVRSDLVVFVTFFGGFFMLPLLIKLLRREALTAEDVFKLLQFIVSKTKIELDDKLVDTLYDLYKQNPEGFDRLITIILSAILSIVLKEQEKTNTTCCESSVATAETEEEEEEEEEVTKTVVEKEEKQKKEEQSDKQQEINDLLKSLFS